MKGLEIKRIRKENSLTQSKLGEILNVSKSLVQKWEAEERKVDEIYIDKIIALDKKNTKNTNKTTENTSELNQNLTEQEIFDINFHESLNKRIETIKQEIVKDEEQLKTIDSEEDKKTLKEIITRKYVAIKNIENAKLDKIEEELGIKNNKAE